MPRKLNSKWLVLAVTVLAQFMVILDLAVVNVALPAMKHDLHFSQDGLQWVITSYSILFAGALLLGGRLADLLGRRRLFVAGVALFTLSSLLSGLAWSAASLIVFRSLQGLGGALLSPAALSILVTTFPEGRGRNTALGVWGAASGSGGAVGVLLGGVLTSSFGWPWIFFVNLPIGALVLASTPFILAESRAALSHRHFDVRGATAITAGLMLLAYGIARAAQHGWGNATTIGLLAAAVALVSAFVGIEHRSPAPLLPLRIFRSRTVTAANATMLTVGAVGFAQFFVLTLYLQQVLHYSAIRTGVAFLGITVVVAVSSNAAQQLSTRFGARRVLVAGTLISALAGLVYAHTPVDGHYFTDVLPGFVLGGVGLAFSFVPVTIAGMTGVAPADAGVASGLINTTRQVGGSIGLAVVTTIAAAVTGNRLGPAALDHGFHIALYTLVGVSLAGAVFAALIGRPRTVEAEVPTGEPLYVLKEAA
ncbi:MAG TPA: MFS transporter [Gaiellaceae bacterium]|nr:MFS transporter [Gaiellaceae bacterium]